MTAAIRRVTPGEGELLRRVRLRALADSPEAFGSTLADEAELPAQEWTWRANVGAAGEEQIVFLAFDEAGEPLGMAGGRWYGEDGETVALWGMWVEPGARGGGLAQRLVGAIVEWATAQRARRLRLGVMVDCARAVAFYDRCGFAPTGVRRPLQRDPARAWVEMSRPLEG